MKPGELYATGLNLSFFSSSDFEPCKSDDSVENSIILGRNILRIMMMGWRDNWFELMNRYTLRAFFWEKNPKISKGFRLAFQQGLLHVFKQLKVAQLNSLQHKQAILFLHNALMFYPYTDPQSEEIIFIPQWIQKKWQLVQYKVDLMELTPSNGFEKLFIPEGDRVFAYGLKPLDAQIAHPYLIFMGTTYPGGQGFFSTIRADLEPFATAGRQLYLSGKANITRWLNQQSKKAQIVGTSLGGAISLMLAIDQGDKLLRVDALNPPGLYFPWFKNDELDQWHALQSKPQVVIQRQKNDPVTLLGVWKKEWQLLHVIPNHPLLGSNRFADHGISYAGFANTKFIALHTQKDSLNNLPRAFFIYTLLRSGSYYLLLNPYHYLFRPFGRLVLKHKESLALMGSLFLMRKAHESSSSLKGALKILLPAALGYILIKQLMAVQQKLHLLTAQNKENALPGNTGITMTKVMRIIKVANLLKRVKEPQCSKEIIVLNHENESAIKTAKMTLFMVSVGLFRQAKMKASLKEPQKNQSSSIAR